MQCKKNNYYRLKACQRNMVAWLQLNHNHMNKTGDTKETVRQEHHQQQPHWIHWNKNVTHWWTQAVLAWLALHLINNYHRFQCIVHMMHVVNVVNAAQSANKNHGKVCFAMVRAALTLARLTNETGKYRNISLKFVKNEENNFFSPAIIAHQAVHHRSLQLKLIPCKMNAHHHNPG